MFDFFSSLENSEMGEVEMVSLVPEYEEEPTPVMERSVDAEKVAMSRRYVVDGLSVEIAYINYNKVRIKKGEDAPILKEFPSSKEAVDYYVEQMQEYEKDE